MLLTVLLTGFERDGFITKFMNQANEPATPAHNCRGNARDYVSPFDGKTYAYKCDDTTGIWAYTDRYNDPSCNLIKGNIAYKTGEKIYHTRGQAYYNDTHIDLKYGEKFFCSEQEAIQAGWRKSYE